MSTQSTLNLLLLFTCLIKTEAQFYTPDICGTEILDQTGIIFSENYPDKYPNNVDCSWTILASENNVISTSFTKFSLEISDDCTKDYFLIFDGEDLLGEYCSTKPDDFVSTTNNVTFVYHTDADRSEQGFQITWGINTGVSRKKRSNSDLFISQYEMTEEKINNFLIQHNGFRGIEGSSDMRKITWDNDIAEFAATYVRNCDFGHSNTSVRHTDAFAELGENLYMQRVPTSSFDQDPLDAVLIWYNEVVNYDYDTQTCAENEQCGHYTQFVWAETYKIGCGAAYCNVPPSLAASFDHILLTSCNYGVAGNVIDLATQLVGVPFLKGQACSACSNPDDICESSLCANSESDQPITTTTTTTTTTATTTTTTATTTTTTATTTPSTALTATTIVSIFNNLIPAGLFGDANHRCVSLLLWFAPIIVTHFIVT